MEVFGGDGKIVLEVFRCLFGAFADYRLVESPVLFQEVGEFTRVTKGCNEALSQCSFMPMFLFLMANRQWVARRVHLQQLQSHPWDARTQQCALKSCKHQTGTMVPFHFFREPSTIEEWLRVHPRTFVVCSTECLRHVAALVHGLSGVGRGIRIVRGTHECSASAGCTFDALIEQVVLREITFPPLIDETPTTHTAELMEDMEEVD